MKGEDRRNPGFLIVDNEVLEVFASAIRADGIAVYCALVMCARNTGEADPSMAKIAGLAGMSPRKARMVVADLERHGLISVERRPTGRGRMHETNAYTVRPVAKLDKYIGRDTTARGAEPPTAQDAEPLRHAVPNPTAPRAESLRSGKTKKTTATDTGKRLPAQPGLPTVDAWDPVDVALSEALGGIPLNNKDGTRKAAYGAARRSLGKHNGHDPAASIQDIQRMAGWASWYRVRLHNFADEHAKWVSMGRPNGRPTARSVNVHQRPESESPVPTITSEQWAAAMRERGLFGYGGGDS